VLGGLEALGRTNVQRIAEVIGDDKMQQILDGKLRIHDLGRAVVSRLQKEDLVDETGRIRGVIADAQGYVDYQQLNDAFVRDLRMTGVLGFAATSVAPAGDGSLLMNAVRGPEILVRHLAGHLDGMRLNLWKLPEGGVPHNYDSLILTETGKFSEERLQQLMQHAVDRNGTKVMTRDALMAAIYARYGRDADRPGSAIKGINFALVEFEGLASIRPQGWTEQELRDLYRDKKFPADLRARPPATLFDLMKLQIPEVISSTPRTVAHDVRRLLNAVGGALGWPGTHGGRAQRGADLSTGEGGASSTLSDASIGLAAVEVGGGKRTGNASLCPVIAAANANQLATTHKNAIDPPQS
jgi:hypothetical protein